MIWIAATLAIIAFFMWWLLIRTEGVYLGRWMVVKLYDLYAKRYDKIVQHEDVEEHLHLAMPLMERLDSETEPLILDVATGTGRLPLALCQHARFEGYIIGLDASYGMLEQAVHKIRENHFDDYVDFVWGDGLALPFEENSFDVVTCMEALEFMPSPEQGLQELVRVLRSGGLLLTTRRINEPLMATRLWSQEKMLGLLNLAGINEVKFERWQYDYEKVWGVKAGDSEFIGAMPLDEIALRAKVVAHESGIFEIKPQTTY